MEVSRNLKAKPNKVIIKAHGKFILIIYVKLSN